MLISTAGLVTHNSLEVAGAGLVGGAMVSVLPLGFLPFSPEQSVGHYGAHLIYLLTQIPVVWLAWRVMADERSVAAAAR